MPPELLTMASEIPQGPSRLDEPILRGLTDALRSLLTESARSSPADRSIRISRTREWHLLLLKLSFTCQALRTAVLPLLWERMTLYQGEVVGFRKVVSADSLARVR